MSRSVLSTLISCRAKFDIRSVPGFPDSASSIRDAEIRRQLGEIRREARAGRREAADERAGMVQRVRRSISRAS